jgi:hypothetical protein
MSLRALGTLRLDPRNDLILAYHHGRQQWI